MKMKRVIPILLAFALVLSLLPSARFTAAAYSDTDIAYPVEGGNIYFDKSTGAVTDCEESVTMANIPAEIDGVAVTSIGEEAFYDCRNLTTVIIPDTIEYIESFAFGNCYNLSGAYFLGNAPTVHESAFWVYFESLTGGCLVPNPNLTIYFLASNSGWTTPEWNGYPTATWDGVYTLHSGQCGDDATWTIDSEGVLTISGTGATWDCEPQYIYYVEDTDTTFGVSSASYSEFYEDVKKVVVDEGITALGDFSLWFAAYMEEVSLPESLESIGGYSFWGCNSLTEIEIPKNVTMIEERAFSQSYNLAKISVAEGNTAYCVDEQGVLYTKDMTCVLQAPPSDTDGLRGTYVVADGVKRIAECAFMGADINCIVLPESLESIGGRAFFACVEMSAACFLGDAPEIDEEIPPFENIVTLYYIDGKDGWTTPEWNGYSTATWDGVNMPHLHTYTVVVTEPTCTEQGYVTYTCECGESVVVDYFDALGHDYVDGVCTRCGADDPSYEPFDPTEEFTDIPSNAWYLDSVAFAVENGLMNGMGNGEFQPDEPTTRAMVVTILYRLSGSEEKYENSFTDVLANNWYTNAISWAAHYGIVNGMTATTFEPETSMTREMLAVILYRYTTKKTDADTSKKADLSVFPDESSVSPWAKEAMQWAVANGIVNGVGDGKTTYLQPLGNATRAQVAAIFQRYIKNVLNK